MNFYNEFIGRIFFYIDFNGKIWEILLSKQ